MWQSIGHTSIETELYVIASMHLTSTLSYAVFTLIICTSFACEARPKFVALCDAMGLSTSGEPFTFSILARCGSSRACGHPNAANLSTGDLKFFAAV